MTNIICIIKKTRVSCKVFCANTNDLPRKIFYKKLCFFVNFFGGFLRQYFFKPIKTAL
jgi:hypothetical protein